MTQTATLNKGNGQYRAHPFVSNSDLSRLKSGEFNLEAFRIGTLFHSVVLEPKTVDIIKGTVEGYAYDFTQAEIKLARAMRVSLLNDGFCRQLLSSCQVEVEMYNPATPFEDITLDTKRKYDLFSWASGWGGDIKSTSAQTYGEFMKDVDRFDYDRARVFYAQGSGAMQDVIIGVSKSAPHRIFKVFMRSGDPLWKRGEDKMNELAHTYHRLNPAF